MELLIYNVFWPTIGEVSRIEDIFVEKKVYFEHRTSTYIGFNSRDLDGIFLITYELNAIRI
jgi:hypothetical protein